MGAVGVDAEVICVLEVLRKQALGFYVIPDTWR
jgi:hypothetical protein